MDNKTNTDNIFQGEEYRNAIIGNSTPLIYVESLNARHERKEARILICSAIIMLITIVTCILVVYFNNLSWQKFFENFDFESYEVSADGNSNANYIGGNGDINNGGENKDTQSNNEENEEERETDKEEETE